MVDEVVLSLVVIGLMFLATIASALFAAYSFGWIEHPLSESYGMLMTVDSFWAGGSFLMLVAGGTLLAEVGLFIKALFSAVAAFAWLRFVSEYTGDSEWLPGWLWWLGAAESIVWSVLVVSNPGGLMLEGIEIGQFGVVTAAVETPGLGAAVQLLIGASLVGLSLFLLGRFFLQTQGIYRYQALIIFAIGAIVLVSTTLFISDYQPHPLIDPTPILFNLQAVGVGWALYRYDFLRVAPVIVTRFFREMDDPVLLINGDRVVADYNAAADALVDDLRTQVSIDAIEDPAFSEMLTAAVTDGGTATEFIADTDSRRRIYDIEVTRVTDQFDTTQGYMIVLRDITDRKQRERQLEEQNERLEEFADVVSHDLRNPLSTAEGWVAAVTDALDGEEPDVDTAQMGLEHIAHSHDRMDELIEVLLTMARQGQTVADPEPVSLETCATKAWATAETGEMTLRVDTDRTVPADPARLRQAFENLFRNANDHSEAATVVVTTTPEGFAVEDDGIGIDPDDREDLFAFGYSTNEEGTGIGLAVVKRIIEAHGWRITVGESDDGGACFEVTGVST
jgi:signal transduction histidine kinase